MSDAFGYASQSDPNKSIVRSLAEFPTLPVRVLLGFGLLLFFGVVGLLVLTR
jgi:hypothetical protein